MVKINLQVKEKVVTTNKTYRDFFITKKGKKGKSDTITKNELLKSVNKITKKYAQKIINTDLTGFTTSINAMLPTGDATLGAYIPFNKNFREYTDVDLFEDYEEYLEGKIRDKMDFTRAYSVTVRISYKTV
jgi:hypothetical protein